MTMIFGRKLNHCVFTNRKPLNFSRPPIGPPWDTPDLNGNASPKNKTLEVRVDAVNVLNHPQLR
jgi:hypothetical protein